MSRSWPSSFLLSLLVAAPAARAADLDHGTTPARPNIVLIVLDDTGVDLIRAYGEGPPGVTPACTPNLDALAAGGLLFRNVWTNPVCSPSRAQILTGRHGFRTGIGKGIAANGRGPGLRVDLEELLPRTLAPYDSSAVGKWHLMSSQNGDLNQPLDAGFGYYAGSLYNLGEKQNAGELCAENGPLGYTNWVKTHDVDGTGTLRSVCSHDYATSDTADEAILCARTMQAPWFLYVAFNANHWPFEAPPRELCSAERCPEQCPPASLGRRDQMNAMVAATDAEVGRMLAEIRRVDPGVIVLVIGDNGSELDSEASAPEDCFAASKSKSTLFEHGVRVPLLVSGPGVVPGECAALVNSTDLQATIAELAGCPTQAEDSVSLVPYLSGDRRPLRRTIYAEVFTPNQPSSHEARPFAPNRHMRAIRNARFKLVRVDDGERISEQLYDLANDPCEQRPLAGGSAPCDETKLGGDALASYRSLKQELQALGVY